jgi:hypothetical protein
MTAAIRAFFFFEEAALMMKLPKRHATPWKGGIRAFAARHPHGLKCRYILFQTNQIGAGIKSSMLWSTADGCSFRARQPAAPLAGFSDELGRLS